MVDQRGSDAKPRFTISSQAAQFKYHAVLTEPVYIPTKFIFDARDEVNSERTGTDGVEVFTPMGIYGFHRVEDRDKFCRRANAAAEVDEHKVAFGVTILPAELANLQPLITGPVAQRPTKET